MSKNKPTGFLRRYRASKAEKYEGPPKSRLERFYLARHANLKAMDMESECKVERTR